MVRGQEQVSSRRAACARGALSPAWAWSEHAHVQPDGALTLLSRAPTALEWSAAMQTLPMLAAKGAAMCFMGA